MTIFTQRLLFFFATATAGTVLTAQVFTPPQVRKPKTSEIPNAFTVGTDEAGCKDSLLLPRVAGCSILQCNSSEDESVEIFNSVDADGSAKEEEIDGASETIYYLCPVKVTHAAIVTNAEARLIKDGYKIIARNKQGDDEALITAVKDRQWVQITTYPYENSSAYIQTALLAGAEEQIDADAVAQELSKSGRVALTGFRFDRDKADLPAGSDKLLGDFAALLAKKPEWKIRVEVQCDESVDAAQCKSLGGKRADAVAGTLVAKGVDKERVTAQPLAAPGASTDDTAKAHIQLVKY